MNCQFHASAVLPAENKPLVPLDVELYLPELTLATVLQLFSVFGSLVSIATVEL
jgi:hypothetical protein